MRAIDAAEKLDLVTQDMLIGESGQLEQFHWFVRAHLEAPDGSLTTGDARTEKAAQRRPLPNAPPVSGNPGARASLNFVSPSLLDRILDAFDC